MKHNALCAVRTSVIRLVLSYDSLKGAYMPYEDTLTDEPCSVVMRQA